MFLSPLVPQHEVLIIPNTSLISSALFNVHSPRLCSCVLSALKCGTWPAALLVFLCSNKGTVSHFPALSLILLVLGRRRSCTAYILRPKLAVLIYFGRSGDCRCASSVRPVEAVERLSLNVLLLRRRSPSKISRLSIVRSISFPILISWK